MRQTMRVIRQRGDPLQIDLEEFRRHYASLSDEGLRQLDRSELIGAAQKCYDEEVALRELSTQQVDSSAAPDWVGESACACSFASFPGIFSASDAANARGVLEAAGIPCHISVHERNQKQRRLTTRRCAMNTGSWFRARSTCMLPACSIRRFSTRRWRLTGPRISRLSPMKSFTR
jgi:hypothetical protein